ncbi:TolC family protein [Chryseobacterium sp. SSA4.19]|uniref:TolC family protein n=1 Tax=Chryseobacterium sp. SSA4.19 TaxID=2919915 RepID=UPI001F4E9C54|nr:TolC family protein [Chryseobacterium sp. SSA4.19]MCJ8153289.1 TolC family protein [Chryseobacterium sp. SSA4.19]
MSRRKVLLFIFFIISIRLFSQSVYDINYFIANIHNTHSYKITENEYKIKKIENGFLRKSLLPNVNLDFSLPYQRSISDVTQPDGTIKFLERNFLNSYATLNTSQVLAFTGGTINLSNSINYSRDFNNNYTNFSSNWVNFSYRQPINGYNSYKWDRKINKLVEKKDSVDYLKNKIKIRYEVAKAYIDAENAQLKSFLLIENIKKSKSILHEISEKFKHGRAIKTDVIQMELNVSRLQGYLKVNAIECSNLFNQLERVSGIEFQDSIVLKSVEEIEYSLDKEELIGKLESNGFGLEWAINELKAEANYNKIKKEGSISLNLQAGIGINSSANEITDLFHTPLQTQFLTLGIKIPILDWGVSKDKVTIAQIERENLKLKKEEDEEEHIKSIEELISYYLNVKSQIEVLKHQIILSDKLTADYKDLLLLGRITSSEFNNQLYENINLTVDYEKNKNNLYLLKFRIEELNLNTNNL